MKISELNPIAHAQRDIILPLSVNGQNMSITLGQIIDALSLSVVSFDGIAPNRNDVNYFPGSDQAEGNVIFDPTLNRFYMAIELSSTVAGQTVSHWSYFGNWSTYHNFYDDEGNVRTDCLFISSDGRLYRYNGTALISAGITDAQAQQIKLLTPQPVESESALQAMEAAGLIVPGQLYYIPEDD